MDDVVARIREVAPGVLVGAALSDDPMGPATVVIKGPSTPDIDAIIASAPVQVLLVADQPYSLEELEERSIRVAQALLAAGIRSQSVGTDIRNGATIPASISQADGITPDERSAILAAIPDDLRASVQLTVVDPPIAAYTCAGGSPSPSPAPGIGPLTCLTFPDDWGPLAVVDDAGLGGLDAGLGPGHLAFRRGCVTLQGRRGPGVTLVWRAGQVRWDVEARQIVFAHATDGLIRLSDGDRMILGGFSPDSSPDPGEEGLRLQPWVQAPRPGCPTESWEVHDLTRLPR